MGDSMMVAEAVLETYMNLLRCPWDGLWGG